MGLEDIGRFDVPVDDSHFEEILDCFDDFCNDSDGFFLTEFAVSSEELKQISIWTVLGDYVAVVGMFVDVLELEDVGMFDFFEDRDLVLKHLHV